MRRAWLHVLVFLALVFAAGSAAAQDASPRDGAVPRGPYVGDETHRTPLDSDIPFPEGVTPRDRPLVFARPSARAGRAHASRGRHAATSRRHRAAKGTTHRRRRR